MKEWSRLIFHHLHTFSTSLELRQEGVEPCARAPIHIQDSRNLQRTGCRDGQIPFEVQGEQKPDDPQAVNFLLCLADHAAERSGIDGLVTTH